MENEDVITGLAHVFIGYRLRAAELRENEKTKEQIIQELGPPPWDVVNEALRVAEFPYRVQSPLSVKLADIRFALVDTQSSQTLSPGDLSSGERIILQLVLWLYNSQNHGRFPRLFLLDEPDAHLHPSLTRQFMDVIQEVLVRQFRVRVILTTHSPSTVAMAPDGSIFEMTRKSESIKLSPSREHTIGLLTAGLVTVFPSTRFVLVEDEVDVQFYRTIQGILTDFGPSKDPCALRPAPSIVFLPASVGRAEKKIGGGKSVVKQWVEKFEAPPLSDIFRGIIDRDEGNIPSSHVSVLERYSIENYLLDPFVIFGLLLEDGKATDISGLTISSGDEHRIRALSAQELGAISIHVLGRVAPLLTLKADDIATRPVRYTHGQVVDLPNWMFSHKGHSLLPAFQKAFGDPHTISPVRLLKIIRRVLLIPSDLADVMHALQR